MPSSAQPIAPSPSKEDMLAAAAAAVMSLLLHHPPDVTNGTHHLTNQNKLVSGNSHGTVEASRLVGLYGEVVVYN